MLLQRALTALVLAPLMLAGIFLLPDLGFRMFIGVIVVLGAWEWANISGYESIKGRAVVTLISVAIMLLFHYGIDVQSNLWIGIILATIVWWLFASFIVVTYPSFNAWLSSGPLRVLVMVPVFSGFWMGLVWLKLQPASAMLLTWFMLLVWGADVGAYFAGRMFGKKKLAPNVSPGKTWAGVYGGMATSILISVVFAYYYLTDLNLVSWLWLTGLSIVVIVISVMGDLFESLLKRNRGIKDSSSLLPGHGGVLDRIDSLCSAAPVFVLMWYVLAAL